MTPRALLLAVLVGALMWLILLWSLADRAEINVITHHDNFSTTTTLDLSQHQAAVRLSEVSRHWVDLATAHFLREYEAERQARERKRAAARATRPAPVVRAASSGRIDWEAVRRCECPPGWHCNTGNGYYGGLQFSLSSWRAVGGTGYPHEHSRATQIAMAERLSNGGRNMRHWPTCAARLGYL